MNIPRVWTLLTSFPVWLYLTTRLHWGMSNPSSPTDVAISTLTSPEWNCSRTLRCWVSDIPCWARKCQDQRRKDQAIAKVVNGKEKQYMHQQKKMGKKILDEFSKLTLNWYGLQNSLLPTFLFFQFNLDLYFDGKFCCSCLNCCFGWVFFFFFFGWVFLGEGEIGVAFFYYFVLFLHLNYTLKL